MSLRTRLIVSILVVMMAAICLSGVVVIWNGKRQVYIELSASLNVATATARNNFRFLHERPDRRRVLQG
ncbi:MAG: hypothetical protein PHI71_11580, partial [Acidiphilium sp.]|nr:hypothetical protein [Acidiphilium sp.]